MGEVQPKQSSPVPSLDPATPYYSRLSARSALYTEFRLLMDSARSGGQPIDYRSLVLDSNVLSRASAAARAKMWKELKGRYGLSPTDPLFQAFLAEWSRCKSDPERALTAYVLFTLNDRLVTDLGTQLLFPLLRRAPAELRVQDVIAFIAAAERGHPELGGWTENTRRSWAQDYCASVRDFGLAKGMLRKTTIRPALHGAPVRLMVRALRLAGVKLAEVIRAPVFRLLGVDAGEVVDAFGELNRLGEIRFRIQGDVIELDLEEQA